MINGTTTSLDCDKDHDSRARLISRLLAENTRDIIFRYQFEPQFGFDYISPSCLDITGYTAEQFYRDPEILVKLLHPDETVDSSMMHNDFVFGLGLSQMCWICRDGETIWVEIDSKPVVQDGQVVAVEGIIRDITNRKLADIKLVKSQRSMATLLCNLPGMAYRCKNDRQWTMEFVSAGSIELTGYEPDELIESKLLPFNDVIVAQDRQMVWASVQVAVAKRQSYQITYRIMSRDGQIKWVWEQGQGVFTDAGQLEAIEGFITDITHNKTVEASLKASEEKYRALIEASDDIIFQLDVSGKIEYISPRVTALYGWDVSELTGEYIKLTTPRAELSNAFKAIRTVLKGGTLKNFEITQRDKFGRLIPMEVNASPIMKNDKIVGIHGIMRDISERKHTEIELRRVNESLKEHDKMKNEFVSMVSHELRTPLCIFKNIVSNIMAGVFGKINPKLHNNLEMANSNIDRLARIVNDFLDVSKIEAGKMRLNIASVEMQNMISEVVETFLPLIHSKNLHIKVVMQDKPIMVSADKDKLIQVLTNLLSNSVKFTPPRGVITVTMNNYNEQVAVAVSDTGIGIDAQNIEKLFDRYFQVQKTITAAIPGTGLGLAIVKELVEMHGGKVWAESELGKGSTFTFVLNRSNN